MHKAVCCFQEGFNCSQALLSTYGEQFGLDRELALKMASTFGAGMGMGEICGAVTGAFMIIGAKYGKSKADEHQSADKACGIADDFVNEFISRNKYIVCRELLGCDISTPEGMKLVREKGLLKALCPKFVQDAAEIIERLL
ncbi:MAG: C_GCAxxG_C_C family protein [Nitrospirae bacterium]|nr:C_GCAxxG_C_C family protein [Nitrospirota bacterium]